MRYKLYDAYKSGNEKEFNKLVNKLSHKFHDGKSCRIVDMINSFEVTTGVQDLKDISSYAAFNSLQVNEKYNKKNLITVNKNMDLKDKRMFYAYHFFQYLLTDHKEGYYCTCYDYSIHDEFYKMGRDLLLPKDKLLRDYKKTCKDYSIDSTRINYLSDLYEVPSRDVEKRLSELLNEQKENKASKKPKLI